MSNPFFENTRLFIPGTTADANEINAQFNDLVTAFDDVETAKFDKAGGVFTGAVGVTAGTEVAPGVYISGDTDTGFYSPAPNNFGISTGGVGRFLLSNTLLALSVGLMVSGSTALAGLTVSGNATLGDAAGDTVTVNAGTTTFVQGVANGVGYLNASKAFTTSSALTFDGSRISVNGNIIKANEGLIRDVATGFVAISGGTSVNTSSANGGGVVLGYGNSHATTPGKLLLGAGDVAGGIVELTTANATRQTWDRAGNTGLGVIPPDHGIFRAFDISTYGGLLAQIGGTSQVGLGWNVAGGVTTNTYRYKRTGDVAALLEISSDGALRFWDAPVGTAGADIAAFTSIPDLTLFQGNLDISGNITAGVGTVGSLRTRNSGSVFEMTAIAGAAGMTFVQNGVGEAARFTGGQNLVLGGIAEINNPNRRFSVYAATGANVAAAFYNDGGPAAQTVDIANAGATGDNSFVIFYTDPALNPRGSIDFNRAGGLVRYNTTSDQTLKTLIGDAPQEKSLTILRETRLREYYWNDDPDQKPQITPFAQELHQTFPGAVSVGGWYDEVIPAVTERVLVSEGVQEVQDDEGNVLIPGQEAVYETVVIEPEHTIQKYRPWGVDKTAFSFHLVAGFQYHDQRIAELQARLEALEAA